MYLGTLSDYSTVKLSSKKKSIEAKKLKDLLGVWVGGKV